MKNSDEQLRDLKNQPLRSGDRVHCHRFGLGTCDVVTTQGGLAYRSIDTGEERQWSDLVDEETQRQHVTRMDDEQKTN